MLIDDLREILVASFEALAPNWDEAPDWAQWYAVDGPGGAYWYGEEPRLDSWSWMAYEARELWEYAGPVAIPLGIDWRLCVWQRRGGEHE